FLLAEAEFATQDLAAAAVDFETSARMLEAEGDRYSAWIALMQLAAVEGRRQRPTAALARFEQALALLRALEDSPALLTLEGPERLSRFLGLSPPILRLLRTGPETTRANFLRGSEAVMRLGIAATLLADGRLKEAEAEMTRLVDLSRSVGGAADAE